MGLLDPYRVIDLSSDGVMLGSRVLADLGADVIQIEPPGGDSCRWRGPFYGNVPHADLSLYWWFCNLNKRGITLNLESAHGRRLLLDLASRSDFLFESFPPGYLAARGLGFDELHVANPRLILVSVTPYGQTGPYARQPANDLVVWAMGGEMYPTGDSDRPPLQVSQPQAYFHGGVEGAVGALIAHFARLQSGLGQQVDVSIQECIVWTSMDITGSWDIQRANRVRSGGGRTYVNDHGESFFVRAIWPCRNGFVSYSTIRGSPLAEAALLPLIAWMDEVGMATAFMKTKNWRENEHLSAMDQEEIDRLELPIAAFFMTKTVAELWTEAVRRRILLAPVMSPSDLHANDQLAARDFWWDVHHPGLDQPLIYPGPFVKISVDPLRPRRPPPRLGEHNAEVFQALGLSDEDRNTLAAQGII